MARRTAPPSRIASCPATVATPASGWVSVTRTRTAVDLPAPFGPSSPKISPSGTVNVAPSSACTSPYRFRRPSTTIASTAFEPTRLTSAAVDLYEYQGKELFRRFDIPVSDGRLATSAAEARAAAEELDGRVVVKAQVLTGGRGKAGGVKLAEGRDDAERIESGIIWRGIRRTEVRKGWVWRESGSA